MSQHITLKPSRFFSLFKVFTIQRGDFKKVSQKKLKSYDYLWKVLVYGNYLDFNLINRLKNDKLYSSIGEITSNREEFLIGQGAMIGGGDENDSSNLIGKPFIYTRKDIKPFWINDNTTNVWEYNTVHRPRNKKLYKAPFVLITGGTDTSFRSVSAVSEVDAVFKSSLTAIKSIEGNIKTLKSICGILNSSLFSYFSLQTFSSSGIEREESHDKEKFGVPFVDNESIVSMVSSITKLKEKEEEGLNTLLDLNISNNINNIIKKLDNAVISAFSFSEQEKDLLNYSTEVVIPMIMKHKGYKRIFKSLELKSETISEYANLFFECFNSVYKRLNKKLIVKVKHTNQIIGLFFELIPLNSEEASIQFIKEEDTM